MATSFKETMKNVVFLWGAISLGLIILIILYMMTSNIRHYNKQREKSEETLHEKTFGDVKLNITGKYGAQEPQVLINITQKNKKIVENFLLPTHEKGFDYVRFYDSLISPAGPNKYHVMLFTVADDCENTSNQVWFLSLAGHLNFIRVDDLFDMRQSKSDSGPIFGNKHYRFPYIRKINNRQYVIPVEINANDMITITPLLNDRGVTLLRTDFDHDVDYINSELKKFPDQSTKEAASNRSFMPYEKFMQKFNNVQQGFNEAIQGNSTSW